MCDSRVGEMWLISWRVVGNLRGIGRCCWIMCVELWAREWLNKFLRVDEEEKVALLLEKGWRAYVTE